MNTSRTSDNREPAGCDAATDKDALGAGSALPSSGRAGRNEMIDVVRFFAAAGIVYIHAAQSSPSLDPSRNFFRFAVPFFLFASLYYQGVSGRKKRDGSLWQFIVKRVKRLYLPFLAWGVIYLIARGTRNLTTDPSHLVQSLLWKGTQYHLWFLPLLLACSIVMGAIQRFLRSRGQVWRWALITIVVAAGFAMAFVHMPLSWTEDFENNPTYAYVQFWKATPAACWAMACAMVMTMGSVVWSVSRALGWGGLLLGVAASVKQVLDGIQLIPRALSGLGCLLLSLAPWAWPTGSLLARLGRYGYGIYLCHVLFVRAFQRLAENRQVAPSIGRDLVTFVLSFVASVAFAVVIGRSRRLRWLNG